MANNVIITWEAHQDTPVKAQMAVSAKVSDAFEEAGIDGAHISVTVSD